MLVADLQSWAKCGSCGMVLWVEPASFFNENSQEQNCGCECGGLELHNEVVTGSVDESFTEAELQAMLDAEY